MNAKIPFFWREVDNFLFSHEENNGKTISHVKLLNERRKPIFKKTFVEMCFSHCPGEIIAAWYAWRWWNSTCKKIQTDHQCRKFCAFFHALCEFHVWKNKCFIASETIFLRALFGSLVIALCPFSTQLPKNQFFGQGGVSRSALRSHSSSGWDYLASFGFLFSYDISSRLQNRFLYT